MGNRTIWLMINVTFDCNRNCSFCYVQDEWSGTITKQVIEKLVSRYKEHLEKYGHSRHNIVSLFGGEPLLYKELSVKVIESLKEITPDIFRDVFTNGDLLDEDFVKWSKETRTTIYLSANNSSLEFLSEKMELVSKYRKYAGLSIVLSKQNLNRLDFLVDLCATYNFHPRLRHEYGGGIDKDYISLYDKILPKTIQRVLDRNYIFFPHFFYEMTAPFWNKPYFDHTCGKKYFVIDPNGDVRICLAQGTKIGNLFDEDFEFVEKMKFHKHPIFRFEGIVECEKCEFKILCGGGCPLSKLIAFNDTRRESPFCSTFKKVFPMISELERRWENVGRKVNF